MTTRKQKHAAALARREERLKAYRNEGLQAQLRARGQYNMVEEKTRAATENEMPKYRTLRGLNWTPAVRKDPLYIPDLNVVRKTNKNSKLKKNNQTHWDGINDVVMKATDTVKGLRDALAVLKSDFVVLASRSGQQPNLKSVVKR